MKQTALPWIFVGTLLLGTSLVDAQTGGASAKPSSTSAGSTRSQVERLEGSAKVSLGTSSEILAELKKNLGSGGAAMKGASAKIDSAIERLKSDSTFSQQCALCSQQLQKQKNDIESLQGKVEGEEVRLLMNKARDLEERLENAKKEAVTAIKVLEATRVKIESWQKIYSQFEAVVGKEEAVAKVRQKLEAELSSAPKQN